ncbi:MAG: hypothetical protein R3E39_21475 [Anaerolineae bacterium]
MTATPRVQRLLIESMSRHLPPSGSTLRLVDVYGRTAKVLIELRPEIEVVYSPRKYTRWTVDPDSIDAVAAYDCELDSDLLQSALQALRPGGRLIIMHSQLEPSETYVKTLENAAFTRILVETGAECPLPVGALIRGEKPHTEVHTVDRVKQVATQDAAPRSVRYVYLLVHQTPHKPTWRLSPEDRVEWEAAGVENEDETVLLVFSSLPKAVEFMQPVVMNGYLTNINKLAKFQWDVVKNWTSPTLLNPSDEILEAFSVKMITIDHSTAEVSDE